MCLHCFIFFNHYYFITIFLVHILLIFIFTNRDDDEDDYPGSFEAELATMDEMEDEFGDMSQVIEEVYKD